MNRPDRLDTHVDHYKVLDVARSADVATIRKAYLASARRHHPDRQRPSQGSSTDRSQVHMHQVNEAWRVLGSADLKKQYDRARRGSVGRSNPIAATSSTFSPVANQGAGFKLGSPKVAAAVQYGPWLVALVALLAVVVLTAYAATSGDGSETVELDNWVVEGECISLFGPGNFTQAPCDEPNDGVVDELRLDEACRRRDARAFEPRARAVVICLVEFVGPAD